MVSKKENNFMPIIAIPPGETIRENMEFLGMNQLELAARLGITPKHLSNIINGSAPITYDTALKLEVVIGPSAEFWMDLESGYQLDKARLKSLEEINVDLEILKDIPYNEMSKFGWVEPTKDKNERVMNTRNYFGVASLGLIKNTYSVSFRQGKTNNSISDFGVLAWLRKAEIQGNKVEVSEFNKTKLRKLIPEFRKLTLEDPEVFYPKMKQLCSDCGVALVLVESLPKTYIQGATIWKHDKAVLALSVRGRKADIFWFTFFHELAHLIHHTKKEFHINCETDTEEDEADLIASDYLIPKEKYDYFVQNYDYQSKFQILVYAQELGIAPCILVGRLLHDKLIDYMNFNNLRPGFKIIYSSN